MKVGEVRESQSKPTDTPGGISPVANNRYEKHTYPGIKWVECPDYVQIYWHYVKDKFTSPAGYGYWQRHLEDLGQPPLLPNLLDLWVVSIESADEYSLNKYRVDVSNTTVDDLKRNILKNRTKNQWDVKHLAYWTEMPSDEIKKIKAGGYGSNYVHTRNRLQSAAHGEAITVYDNGKK